MTTYILLISVLIAFSNDFTKTTKHSACINLFNSLPSKPEILLVSLRNGKNEAPRASHQVSSYVSIFLDSTNRKNIKQL